jgi:protein-S-isoprenylcysteine O-methyltransferase Ste14
MSQEVEHIDKKFVKLYMTKGLSSEFWVMSEKDVPGVVAPPPLIFLSFLLLGIAADWLLALALVHGDQTPRWVGGGALLALAIVLMALGVANFTRAGTPVPTRETTRALVTTGVHGVSRNPLYISLFLFYAGLALLANSLSALVLLLPLALVIRYGVVAREERYLERKFGDAYRDYKARVPRWI